MGSRFELSEVVARDGAMLQGLALPSRQRALALIYIHGLGGDFYGSPEKVDAFAAACQGRGFGRAPRPDRDRTTSLASVQGMRERRVPTGAQTIDTAML